MNLADTSGSGILISLSNCQLNVNQNVPVWCENWHQLMIPITLSLSETTRSLIAREYRTSKEPLVGVVVENYSKYRDELYKNRSAQKTDSLLANRYLGSPILLKIVSENRFSGKTYFYTIAPRPRSTTSSSSSGSSSRSPPKTSRSSSPSGRSRGTEAAARSRAGQTQGLANSLLAKLTNVVSQVI